MEFQYLFSHRKGHLRFVRDLTQRVIQEAMPYQKGRHKERKKNAFKVAKEIRLLQIITMPDAMAMDTTINCKERASVPQLGCEKYNSFALVKKKIHETKVKLGPSEDSRKSKRQKKKVLEVCVCLCFSLNFFFFFYYKRTVLGTFHPNTQAKGIQTFIHIHVATGWIRY